MPATRARDAHARLGKHRAYRVSCQRRLLQRISCCFMPPAACAARSPTSQQAFEAAGGRKVQAKFGASGLLKDEIAAGAKAEVFASANMEHPQALAKRGKQWAGGAFRAQQICALVRPGSRSTSAIAAGSHARSAGEARHLDAESRSFGRLRLGGIPQGRQLKPGAYSTLDAKALQLPAARQPDAPPGRTIYGTLVAQGAAPIFFSPTAPTPRWRRWRIRRNRS